MTTLAKLLCAHRPRSPHRCACNWEGDHYDVHLHDVLVTERNRSALVTGLIDADILKHAGCWDPPSEDAVGQLLNDIDVQLSDLDELEDADEWNKLVEEQELLKEARDRITVYYEDEDRPQSAVPLYRIGGQP